MPALVVAQSIQDKPESDAVEGTVVQEADVDSEQEATVATLKGKFEQSSNNAHKLDFSEMPVKLSQLIELPPPPFPDDWPQMKPEQRVEWAKAFEASEEGKAFAEKRKALVEARNVFDVKLESDGRFIVYDVPHGSYGLRGRVNKEMDDKNFAFEVFGQVEIVAGVDEVELDSIVVLVTRLLKTGEEAPAVKLQGISDDSSIDSVTFRGKYLLLSFWSTESKPSVEFQTQVQQAQSEINETQPLELLSICVDAKRGTGVKHIESSNLVGSHGFTDGWEHEALDNYGVRSIPSMCLIDKEGKILMTNHDFRVASRNATSLAEVIGAALKDK